MAENKKGFILYADQKELFDQLSSEQAGDLIKHIFSYVNDENPVTDNVLINIAFTPIKQQLKRDLVKYETRAKKSRENGKKGGRPKKPKKPTRLNNNLDEPRKPDTVNVTVTGNVKGSVNGKVKDSSLKKEPKKLCKVNLSDFPFTSEFFLSAWKQWLEYRDEIKKPYKTASSEKTALKKLGRENPTEELAILSIEQSIAGSYQGLFKYKSNDTNRKKGGFDPSNFTAQGIDDIIHGRPLSSKK